MVYEPVITALYAALMILFQAGLTAMVILKRREHKISIGHGKKDDLARRIRIHGNFTEDVPFLLILMLILELHGLHSLYLHLYGLAMIGSRAAHAYGLSSPEAPMIFRVAGKATTLVLMILGAFACFSLYLF